MRKETGRVLAQVGKERESQDKKWGEQWHSDCEWSSILGEEFGEAMQEVNRVTFGMKEQTDLRKELLQVAAVAVAWVENIDRTEKP